MNTTIMTCTLVRDPDYREFPSGGSVCTLRVVDNRKYTSKDGKQKEEALFMDVRAFSRLAVTARQFLSKGSKILVVGQLVSDEYTGKDGQKHTAIFISAKQIEFLSAPAQQTAPRHDRPTGPTSGEGGPVPEAFNPRNAAADTQPPKDWTPDADMPF